MAEFVNQRMENMLTELEQMKRIGLYTDEEVKMISKKRKDFEYKIRRHVRCKEDYLKYISYECVLLQNIQLRREKYSIKDKKSDIEYAISKRVAQLYNDLTNRFFDDIEIWLNFIEFCKNVDFKTMVTSSLDRLTQVHGDKPKVWALACRWEYEEMYNVTNAQKFILKGLQRHPSSKDLYIDAIRIELLIAESMKDSEVREKQMERIEIILNNALKIINTTEFIISAIETFYNFDFTSEICNKLFTLLWEKHDNKSETWNFIANCELREKEVSGFDWITLADPYTSSQYPDNLKRFVSVHEIGISKLKEKDSVLNFITGAVNLIENEELNITHKLKVISHALEVAHKLKMLDEQHYELWLQILCSSREKNQYEISKILQEACTVVPTSEFIWLELLKRNIENMDIMLELFKNAKKALPSDKKNNIWNFMIENVYDVSTLKKMSEEIVSTSQNIALNIKPALLEAFYEIGDISLARSEYRSMAITPPFSLELHQAMIKIEKLCESDTKHLKYCFELLTQQFGKNNPDVWIDYVEFSLQHCPENCKLLYSRACSTLENKFVNMFIAKYTDTINKN